KAPWSSAAIGMSAGRGTPSRSNPVQSPAAMATAPIASGTNRSRLHIDFGDAGSVVVGPACAITVSGTRLTRFILRQAELLAGRFAQTRRRPWRIPDQFNLNRTGVWKLLVKCVLDFLDEHLRKWAGWG